MTYQPRPEAGRTGEDVDEIYTLVAEELRKADTPEARRKVFRSGLLRAYEAGVDAQRELIQSYPHERPTPVPPAPDPDVTRDLNDPGLLPKQPLPTGVFNPVKRR